LWSKEFMRSVFQFFQQGAEFLRTDGRGQ
jgi:hypothetical protein